MFGRRLVFLCSYLYIYIYVYMCLDYIGVGLGASGSGLEGSRVKAFSHGFFDPEKSLSL